MNRKSFENLISDAVALPLRQLSKFVKYWKIGRMITFKMAHPRQLLIAEASHLRFLVDSNDSAIGFSTYINKIPFDSDKLSVLQTVLNGRYSTLLDVGANLGSIGITAISRGLVHRVLAFEPDPHNYSLLVANVSINGFLSKIETFNVALTESSKDNEADLHLELDDRNYGDHRIRVSSHQPDSHYSEENRRVIKVPSATLDDFANGLDLDHTIIWMDTQGFEGFILSGAKSYTSIGVPIVTEFWPYGLNRAGCIDKFMESILSGTYTRMIDFSDLSVVHRCDKANLLSLLNKYHEHHCYTDLIIY